MFWHGYPDTFAAFLDLTVEDRFYAAEALDKTIEISNAPRPSETR